MIIVLHNILIKEWGDEVKKVIIIDDLRGKRRDIKEYMSSILGDDTDFIEFGYRNSAVRELMALKEEINSNPADYILVLDMCFPILEDSMPERDEGLLFLHYLQLREINIPVIMCSFDAIDENLLIDYDNVLGSVEYDCSVYLKPQFEELVKKWLGDAYESKS